MKKERQLTTLQQSFLTALFGEAQGDPAQAMKLAGYSETMRYTEVVEALKDEIIDQAKTVLAINASRAAIGLVDVMLRPDQKMATTKMKAAESILDRVGVNTKTQDNLSLEVPQGGLFIMPAKEVSQNSKVIEGEVIDA